MAALLFRLTFQHFDMLTGKRSSVSTRVKICPSLPAVTPILPAILISIRSMIPIAAFHRWILISDKGPYLT